MSLPFQRRWFHLIWSSYEKVIAFQDLQFFMLRKFRLFFRKFRASEVPVEVPMQVPLSIFALGCFHFISGTLVGSWPGSSGCAELPPRMAELPTLRENWPTGSFPVFHGAELPPGFAELPTLRLNWPTGRFLTFLLKGSSSPKQRNS